LVNHLDALAEPAYHRLETDCKGKLLPVDFGARNLKPAINLVLCNVNQNVFGNHNIGSIETSVDLLEVCK